MSGLSGMVGTHLGEFGEWEVPDTQGKRPRTRMATLGVREAEEGFFALRKPDLRIAVGMRLGEVISRLCSATW